MRKFLMVAAVVAFAQPVEAGHPALAVQSTAVVRQRTVTRTAFAAPVVAARSFSVTRTAFAAPAVTHSFGVARTFFAPAAATYGLTSQRTFFAPSFVPTYNYGVARTFFAPALAAPAYSYGASYGAYAAPAALAAPCPVGAPGVDQGGELGALQERVRALEFKQVESNLRAEFDAKLRALQGQPAPLAVPKP